jgi:hypothetical protein
LCQPHGLTPADIDSGYELHFSILTR